MLNDYLIVHKSILPQCVESVIKAKELIETGKVKNTSEAIDAVGISRSTYYKYKDLVIKPSKSLGGKKAVISMFVTHKTGKLSSVLSLISAAGASILTISQNLPIHGRASVTISIDSSSMKEPLGELMNKLEALEGVENSRIIAIE